MQTPTTLDIRNALRQVAPELMAGTRTYTDKLTAYADRSVSFLMYYNNAAECELAVSMANDVLEQRGLARVIRAYRSYPCYGASYMKIAGIGTIA